MKGRTRLFLSLAAVCTAAAAITFGGSIPAGGGTVTPGAAVEIPEDQRAPAGVRIKVEVLNASSARGLARGATAFLRDRGFDVVGTGNAPAGEKRDSTLVIDRSNNPEWAERVARAFGGARVEARPDSSRYLDITVFVGGSWRPPAGSFYP